MTLFDGSMAHVLAAGLAMAAGYGAAACADIGSGQTSPGGDLVYFDQAGSGAAKSALADPRIVDARIAVLPHDSSLNGISAGLALAGSEKAPSMTALASFGSSNGGIMAGFATGLAGQVGSLSWASVPAVPKSQSPDAAAKPLPPTQTRAPRTEPEMPVFTTLAERMGVEGLGAALLEQSALFAASRKRSEPGRLPISRSRLDQAYSHAGDSLAALQLDEEALPPPPPEFIMPFANGRVTSLFNQGRRHPAIDLAGKLGSPVLVTTARQKVVFAGWRGGYGNAVITVDDVGRTHLYGHLQRITSRVGQTLRQGDQLGHLGSTGRSTGPHVHYEVKNSKGGHINPVTLLFPGRGVAKGYAWLDVRQERAGARVAARSR